MSAPPFASIDVGTNSVLLSIVEKSGDALVPVVERATVTRLGQGVDASRRLHPDAIERTLACLRDYKRLLDEHAVLRVAAVGTSALRDSREGAFFLEKAREILGSELQIISGQREAELTFRGALSGLQTEGEIFVFDIGGGSTELIWGERRGTPGVTSIREGTSLDLGSVRLLERTKPADPPREQDCEAVRVLVRGALENYAKQPQTAARVIGVAGTVTSLATLALGLDRYDATRVHGAQIATQDLEALIQRLARLSSEERSKLPGLESGRADVIVCGGLLCIELLKWIGATSLQVSDRGVRWGLLEELSSATSQP